MSEFRLKKIESLLREQVSALIVSQKIKDPRVTPFLTVSQVQVSRDLVYAKIFISSFEGEKKLAAGVDGLNHAAGFIQSQVGKQLTIRNTPRLTFIKDDSIKNGIEMNRILDGLHHEDSDT